MIFGWCSTGMHEGRELKHGTPCPGQYLPIVIERGKVIKGDEPVYCECSCHGKRK